MPLLLAQTTPTTLDAATQQAAADLSAWLPSTTELLHGSVVAAAVFNGCVGRRWPPRDGEQAALDLLKHQRVRMAVGEIEATARREDGGNGLRPAPDIR